MTKVETTNFMEMNYYTETLEKNNKDLKRKLEMIIQSNMHFPISTDSEKKAKNYMVA